MDLYIIKAINDISATWLTTERSQTWVRVAGMKEEGRKDGKVGKKKYLQTFFIPLSFLAVETRAPTVKTQSTKAPKDM